MRIIRGQGRNRVNQFVLNDILRESVEQNHLGAVIDWGKQVSTLPESIITRECFDGRHYGKGLSYAFLNLWINDIFESYPSVV